MKFFKSFNSNLCLMLLTLLLGYSYCSKPKSPGNANQSQVAPLDVGITLPLDLQVRVLDNVQINQIVPVQVKFQARMELKNSVVTIQVPEEVQFTGGKTTWQGDLTIGQIEQFDFVIRPKESKSCFIIARAKTSRLNGQEFSQAASAYLDLEGILPKAIETRPVHGYCNVEKIQVYRPQSLTEK